MRLIEKVKEIKKEKHLYFKLKKLILNNFKNIFIYFFNLFFSIFSFTKNFLS
jgi:hypothetical protein